MGLVYFSILQICDDAVSHGGSLMQDEDVVRKELLAELEVLRRRIAEFEVQEARTRRWVELVQASQCLERRSADPWELGRKAQARNGWVGGNLRRRLCSHLDNEAGRSL